MSKVGIDSSPGDLIGQDFGPYHLVRRLGVGGMAQTFEAIRHGPSGFSQHVCLKLVLPFLRDNQAFSELFKQEARLAAKLRHSNIVGIIDFGEIDGTLYMALELVDGVDLQVLLDAQDRKRLSHDYVALVGRDLARALEHAHNPPSGTGIDGSDLSAIVHRDISPSNVLISRHGEVMLTDFGVAKAITDTWTKQSNVKGKIPYMSPEQLLGEPVDGRADLYALGVVLFEALTGKHPHVGVNEPATIMSALAGNHVPLAELAPDAPPGLCKVIESLLEPGREQRPATASALVELLDELAPPPRARRELGTMVAQTPTADTERVDTGVERSAGRGAEVGALGLADAPTEPARGAVDAAKAAPIPESDRWTRRELGKKTAWVVLGIGGAAASVVALWPDEGPGTGPSEGGAAQGEPESKSETVEEPKPSGTGTIDNRTDTDGAAFDTAVSEEKDDGKTQENDPQARTDAVSTQTAQLTVAVFPWGEIWINGKRRGTAPLKNQAMKPGVYKISAGQGRPSKTQTIRLRRGQQKTVVFDLTTSEP